MRDEGNVHRLGSEFRDRSTDEILEKFKTLSSTLRSSSYEPSPILSDRIRSYLKDELPEDIDRGVEKLNGKTRIFKNHHF